MQNDGVDNFCFELFTYNLLHLYVSSKVFALIIFGYKNAKKLETRHIRGENCSLGNLTHFQTRIVKYYNGSANFSHWTFKFHGILIPRKTEVQKSSASGLRHPP